MLRFLSTIGGRFVVGGDLGKVRRDDGLALLGTLLVITLVGVLAAASVLGALNSLRASSSEYRDSRTFYAAEAGAEAMMAQVRVALQDGYVSNSEIATVTPPTLPGFSFSGYSVEKVGAQRVETITDGPYAGLYALTQDLEIEVPAADASGAYGRVVVGVKAQAIPIFQFGVFYEEDLESHPSPPMDFKGRVHSNGDIYLSSNNSWYWEPITTPNEVIWGYKVDPTVSFPNRKNGVYIHDAFANAVQLTFDSRDTPDPQQFKSKSNSNFDDRLQTDAYGLDSLKLPLPESVPPREIVKPTEGDDGLLEQETKFSWLADMYVTVDLSDVQNVNAVCGTPPAGAPSQIPSIEVTRPGGGAVPTDPEKCEIFGWSWEVFFDSRDSLWVDALELDISELRAWGNLDPANGTELTYVEFTNGTVTNPGGVTSPSADGYYFPILRVLNGDQLPGPLTVATEYPLYVWGDYNTVVRQPAALAGDAITILSNAWDDANHQSYLLDPGWTDAADTELHAALLVGAFPTLCDMWEDPGCSGSWPDIFGGALENNFRFLENWSGDEFLYRGSIVGLWSPVYNKTVDSDGNTTWYCCSGSYYRPPQRNWGFDTAFLNAANLPPGTPVVGSVLRTSFREAY